MRQDFELSNFTAGELSPRMKGRIDYQRYFSGCEALVNMVVMPQGGATRRPGTAWVAAVADQAHAPRLRRFIFSTQQAYVLEFGDHYVRVCKNDGLILNPQAVTGAANNGGGLIRLQLASAAGLYTGNVMTVSGVAGCTEANGTWTISNVNVALSVTGAADNGNGGIRLTVSSTARLIPGGQVTVAGVTGTVEANGTWRAQIVDATHVDLQGSTFATAWVSGGTLTGLDAFAIDLQGSSFAHAYTSGGTTSTVVTIPTPYAISDVPSLYFCQSDDTLYIFHPSYPPATLTRSSHVRWTYAPLVTRDGPYLNQNGTDTTLTVSTSTRPGGVQVLPFGLKGGSYTINPGFARRAVTIRASSTYGINATPESVGQGFLASDVGRHIRIKMLSAWTWLRIESVTDALNVEATIQPTVPGGAWGDLDGAAWRANTYYPIGVVTTNGGKTWECIQAGVSAGTGGPTSLPSGSTTNELADGTVVWTLVNTTVPSSTKMWQLGKWTQGVYPYIGTFWQQRLMMLGSSQQPNAVEGSVVGDFTNFAPTAQDGTVTDSTAVSFVISDDQVNAVQWVKAAGSGQNAALAIGTAGGEEVMSAFSSTQALSATNVQVYPETSNGTAPIEPLRVNKSLVMVDRARRKLLEWTFNWQLSGYNTLDLTEVSEHITAPGIADMKWAIAPFRTIWALRSDGVLLSCAYNKDEQVFAPSRHVLGGSCDGGPPVVESLEIIPSTDTTYDEIWLAVRRTVNGATYRTIEVLTPYFDAATMAQDQAVFLDCSASTAAATPAATLTLSGLVRQTVLRGAAPSWGGASVSLVASAAVFGGAQAGAWVRVNGGALRLTAVADAQHATAQVVVPLARTAAAPAGAWSLAGLNTTISGLGYLEGETVGLLGDGADMGTAVVTGGTVPLQAPGATYVTAGLPYESTIVTMPFEPVRGGAVAQVGKVKRIDTLWLRLHQSLGCSYGRRKTDPDTQVVTDVGQAMLTRSANMPMGLAPRLFSGAKKLSIPGGFDGEAQIFVSTASPLPLTVLGLFARGDVAELPGGGG